jgi:hypothetical protein
VSKTIPKEVKEFSKKLHSAWEKEFKLTLEKRGGEVPSEDLHNFSNEVYSNLLHRLREEDWYKTEMINNEI